MVSILYSYKYFFELTGKPAWYEQDGWYYSMDTHKAVAFSDRNPPDKTRISLFAPVTGTYLGWVEDNWIYKKDGKPWQFSNVEI